MESTAWQLGESMGPIIIGIIGFYIGIRIYKNKQKEKKEDATS